MKTTTRRFLIDLVEIVALFALAVVVSIWASLTYGQGIQQPAEAVNSPEAISLGRQMYFDRRLSDDGTVSCATCHDPARGFSDRGPVSVGVRGQLGTRRAPSLLDAFEQRAQFWDGRADFLEGQCSQPLVAPAEMGQQSLQDVANRLARIGGYREQFQRLFGQNPNTVNILLPIPAFERTLVHSEAPIDRRMRGESWVFDESQERAYHVFGGACIQCHSGESFSDRQFHVLLGATRNRLGNLDRGRQIATKDARDNFKFKTPSLRDVSRRAPYFHGGQAADLSAVMELLANPPEGSEMPRYTWSAEQKADMLHFLSTAFESYDYPIVTPPALPR